MINFLRRVKLTKIKEYPSRCLPGPACSDLLARTCLLGPACSDLYPSGAAKGRGAVPEARVSPRDSASNHKAVQCTRAAPQALLEPFHHPLHRGLERLKLPYLTIRHLQRFLISRVFYTLSHTVNQRVAFLPFCAFWRGLSVRSRGAFLCVPEGPFCAF